MPRAPEGSSHSCRVDRGVDRGGAVLTARTRAQLRVIRVVVLLACVVTPIFNLVTDEASLDAALQGFIDALFVSVVLGGYILFVRDGVWRAWLRERSFLVDLLVNGSAMLVLFLVMRGVGQVVTSGDLTRLPRSFGDPHLRYALPFFALLTFALQFVLQMNRLVGTNVLRYFLAGVYHRPKEEQRIFMFLDLEGSTQLAERLGNAGYYRMLRGFVDDLSEPILRSDGEIHRYIGDAVVVTWRWVPGLRGANCVRCFFRIEEVIARRAAHYEREFGVVPRFRAGLHGGWVTGGELGDLRQEIVFVGDVLNTAARLEDYARQHRRTFVCSGDLIERMELPEGIRAEPLEEFRPRGKAHSVTVYGLARAAPR